jgi:hypothetical protein
VKWAVANNSSRRSAALLELRARMQGDRLTAAQRSAVIEQGLAYQGDSSKVWDFAWGDLLESAQLAGELSPSQWNRYLSQATIGTFIIKCRPNVRLGDPAVFSISTATGRVATNTLLLEELCDYKINWPGVGVVRESRGVQFRNYSLNTSAAGGSIAFGCATSSLPDRVRPGTVHCNVSGHVDIGLAAPGPNKSQPAAAVQIDLPATFALLPADQPTVTSIHNPSLAGAIMKSLSFDLRAGTSSVGMVNVDNNPVGLSFDVLLRDETGERKIGGFACPAGTTQYSFGLDFMNTTAKIVDVILRSNPELAKSQINVFQVWDGELVFKDVPVK